MTDELDEELQGLLDELDDRELDIIEETIPDELEVQEQSEDFKFEPKEKDDPDPLDDLEDINGSDVDVAMRPLDVRRIDANDMSIHRSESSVSTQQDELPEEFKQYKEQLEIVTNEVLNACRSDRQEAQDVINDLQSRMQSISQTGPPPKALVDGLVKAVEVKAGINQNAIKMMDTNAKFIASIKSSININQNIGNSYSGDLEKILSDPVDDF